MWFRTYTHEVAQGRDPAAQRATCIAIGAFDGVHRGHKALIADMMARARAQGLQAAVFTFDPLPKVFFGAAEPILSLQDRLDGLHDLGVEQVHVASFDRAYAARPAEAFLDDLASIRVAEVHVGDDFRFGKGRAGTPELIRSRFRVVEKSAVLCDQGERISSTRIRALFKIGDLETARMLLGKTRAAMPAAHALGAA
ncbi:FAD synthetase family protein [Paracoccus fistulariae]|uniref:FAD synthase n=1 Tax=Paracoccus fistulariae TaxID=658446 RepID=A0ABY7SM95_9RHOB|nr:FAD synthetase family protein [Paracoccus fistulariae]MDB6180031.1 FAD synthetase family protein [Paracoccus fistulariae]WCR08120.1 FAD synthetase family protein [Paracoccus fistulariae]